MQKPIRYAVLGSMNGRRTQGYSGGQLCATAAQGSEVNLEVAKAAESSVWVCDHRALPTARVFGGRGAGENVRGRVGGRRVEDVTPARSGKRVGALVPGGTSEGTSGAKSGTYMLKY